MTPHVLQRIDTQSQRATGAAISAVDRPPVTALGVSVQRNRRPGLFVLHLAGLVRHHLCAHHTWSASSRGAAVDGSVRRHSDHTPGGHHEVCQRTAGDDAPCRYQQRASRTQAAHDG